MHSITQRLRVGSGGTIMIQSPELPEGSMVDVLVVIAPGEQDTTDYLLSTDANRQHLLDALENIENREDLVVISPEEWHEKYCF